ncbi:MAG TPA: acyltransferase [Polyangiaceae bacterium]|nr:acyltransferase [Polyangiaceae bacterium]
MESLVSKATSKNVVPAARELSGHIPELDGVRGFAIVIVLLFHSMRHAFTLGWMGVDLFFVLSGFLITLGLVRSAGEPHYFRNFYAKRALRIWPLYYLILLYTFLIAPLASSAPVAPVSTWLPYALYVQNLLHPLNAPVELGQTWSLAIEEQFYIFWPLVVFLTNRRTLKLVCIALIFGSLVLRLVLAASGAPQWVSYFSTPPRLDGLCLGALLSLLATGSVEERELARRWAMPVALIGAAASIPIALWMGSEQVAGSLPVQHEFVRVFLFSFVGMLSVGVVARALTAQNGTFAGLLRARWLRYSGKISYGMYIYHPTIFHLVTLEVALHVSRPEAASVKLIRSCIGIALTYVVSTLSWYALEKPILRLKVLFAKRTVQPAPAS